MKKISWLFLLVCFILGISFNLLRAEELKISAKNPAFSPDGKKIAFLLYRDRVNGGYSHLFELYTIDTDGNNLKKISGLSDILHSVDCFCWSPNSKKIAYSASKSENTKERNYLGISIFIINSDGSNLLNFIDGEATDEIYWAPDGTKIAVIKRSEYMEIWIMGHNIRYKLTDGTNPVWSPNSKQIAFQRHKVMGADFYTIDIDGKNEKAYELENHFGSSKSGPNQDERSCSFHGTSKVYWSPDGARIYSQTRTSIVVKKINGANEYWRNVMEDPDPNRKEPSDHMDLDEREAFVAKERLNSTLSPDGKEIIFLAYNDICKISSKPGAIEMAGQRSNNRPKPVNLRNLTKTPQIAEEKPQWSPDGRQIVFTRDGELWIMNSDGTDQAQLTNRQTVTREIAKK